MTGWISSGRYLGQGLLHQWRKVGRVELHLLDSPHGQRSPLGLGRVDLGKGTTRRPRCGEPAARCDDGEGVLSDLSTDPVPRITSGPAPPVSRRTICVQSGAL